MLKAFVVLLFSDEAGEGIVMSDFALEDTKWGLAKVASLWFLNAG